MDITTNRADEIKEKYQQGKLLATADSPRCQALISISISLDEDIENTVSILNRSLSEDILIETESADDLWSCMVDTRQLENAVLNLALNSRDAMPSGGTIKISYFNRTIEEQPDLPIDLDPGDYVSIVISDNGEGIPGDVISQVFEPFFTTKETGRGTGLGLSMVFGFVKQSGGHLSIKSTPGKGTAVTILLPRCAAAEIGKVPHQQRTRFLDGEGKTVLLVEDREDIRELTAMMLELMGFEVLQAEHGDEVKELLKQEPVIDILLSDVILPGALKGPDIAKLIKTRFPKAVILLMSGYTQGEVHTSDDSATSTPILSKPFTNQELTHFISTRSN